MLDTLTGDSEKVRTDKKLARRAAVSAELVNLAVGLDDETKAAIAAQVIEDWKADEASRDGWLTMHAKWLELYYQRDRTIAPFPGASTESLPLLTEACNQFQARAFKAFFPGRNFVSGIPVGKPDEALSGRSERIGKFMSWQLGVQDKAYKRNKNALLLSTAIHGSHFTKTYYDPLRRRNVVRNVRAEDLVIPYGVGPRSIEEVERKTEIIWTTVNETRRYKHIGYFIEAAEPYQRGEIEARRTTAVVDAATGTQAALSENKSLALLLEQHLLLDMDKDGIAEPYIAVVDAESERLLRLAIRYEADEVGKPTAGKEPVEYYTHYQFLPNPEGFYGLGLGFLMMLPCLGVNKLLRMFIDAAMLSTAGNMSGFVSDQIALPKGQQELTIGKFTKVTASAEDVAKGFKTMAFPGPTPAMKEAITMLVADTRKLGSAVDVMTGDVDKVLQPTTILTMEENSLQMFTSVQEFLLESWTDELMKLYRLNGLYLDEELYVTIMGQGGPESVVIGRQDFQGDFRVYPAADPRMSTLKQKQQQAQALWQLTLSSPVTATNPEAIMAAQIYVLESIGIDQPARFVPPPVDPGPSPEEKALELKAAETEMKIKSQAILGQQKLEQGQQQMAMDRQKHEDEMRMERERHIHDRQMAHADHQLEQQKVAMKGNVEIQASRQQAQIAAVGAKQDLIHKEQSHRQALRQGEEKNKAAIAAQKQKAAAKPKAK